MSIVDYSVQQHIALIQLHQPPVNSLGHALRSAIVQQFQRASTDDQVEAIVIASSGRDFCGGADINEFSSPELALAEPSLPQLIVAIEASAKPVIAAIGGVALGGGLELALAADYRIASSDAKLGLPEVGLGVIPGAGGTQRLPRIAGVELALQMIVSGKPINASQALQAGIIDRISDNGLLANAINYASELVETTAPVKDCHSLSVDTSELAPDYIANFRASVLQKANGFYAPERCIQAVEASIRLPLDEGLQKEQQLFQECLRTPQARAQQHLFFAQRAAAKVAGVDAGTPRKSVEQVAIIGSGTMGGGIAMNFLNAGIPVTLLDLDAAALDKGIGTIHSNFLASAKKGKLSQDQVQARMSLLTGTTRYQDLAEVDLVIEAVFERMEIKKSVFKSLAQVCKPGCILASNTSTLDINEIANSISRPEDVIGLHFFSPANVMPLLEVVRCDKTSGSNLKTCLQLAKTIKKQAVVVGVCFGFVGNRMLEPYIREACRLLLEGATVTQIDSAMQQFGMAMGPFAMSDLAGLDIGYHIRRSRRDFISHDPSYCSVADRLVDMGRLGQKSGRGMYIYEGRKATEDPEVTAIAQQAAVVLAIEQRAISEREITERLLFCMINEGAQILEEGIARRASDCDLIYANGYGFPVWRGGPMQYADELGLSTVLARLNHYRIALGDYGDMWFKPAALLQRLAKSGQSFKHYDARR